MNGNHRILQTRIENHSETPKQQLLRQQQKQRKKKGKKNEISEKIKL